MVSPQSRVNQAANTASAVLAPPNTPHSSVASSEEKTQLRATTPEVRAMKIAIIRQKYRPDGGGERIVQQMRDILHEEGHHVRLICRSWKGDAGEVLTCNPPKWTRVQRESRFAREAIGLAHREQFDLIQSHERIPGSSIYRAGDGVHATWLEQRARVIGPLSRQWQSRDRFHRYMLEAERALFEHADLKAVICNSRMVLDDIRTRFRISADKLQLIYNGVDNQRFHPDQRTQRDETRKRHGIPEQAPLFLFVGSGWDRKGLKSALLGLSRTANGHLLVVGRDKAEKKFQQIVAKHNLSTRVHFAGVQTEVPAYYGAADAFVLPALYDPFPNAILEAMASGLPVVTSTQCGAVDLIASAENGFVCDSLDIARIGSAMTQLTDLDAARRMGEQARQTVLPLTPEHMRSQLTDLYRKLLCD